MKTSIITINYNNLEGLKKTMQSVFDQTFCDFKYIIIDGGSTDGSKEHIEKHQSKLTYWISEKDNGIYNAMNKGIQNSDCEYIIFLNSGDSFYTNLSLQMLADNCQNEDIIYACLMVSDNQTFIEEKFPETLSFEFFLNNYLPHPGTLIKRSLFDRVGLYNENNKIVSDWEFFLHGICKFDATYRYLSCPIAVFNSDGVSNNPENQGIISTEKSKILETHYRPFLSDYISFQNVKAELHRIKMSKAHSISTQIMNSSLYRLVKSLVLK